MGGTLEKPAPGVRFRIDRGPNWLFVRLSDEQTHASYQHLAEELWNVCVQQFTYRLVVELDDVTQLPAGAVQQFDKLSDRLTTVGGALRLCGANENCQQLLSGVHNAVRLRNHATRSAAVMG